MSSPKLQFGKFCRGRRLASYSAMSISPGAIPPGKNLPTAEGDEKSSLCPAPFQAPHLGSEIGTRATKAKIVRNSATNTPAYSSHKNKYKEVFSQASYDYRGPRGGHYKF